MTDFTLGPGPLTPEFEQVKSDIGIVENGNSATHAIPAGYYVIWKGDLYVARTDISSGTALSAGDNGNLTSVSNGLANDAIKKYVRIVDLNYTDTSAEADKPWLVLQNQWASLPDGLVAGKINCAGTRNYIGLKLNQNYGVFFVDLYTSAIPAYRVICNNGNWSHKAYAYDSDLNAFTTFMNKNIQWYTLLSKTELTTSYVTQTTLNSRKLSDYEIILIIYYAGNWQIGSNVSTRSHFTTSDQGVAFKTIYGSNNEYVEFDIKYVSDTQMSVKKITSSSDGMYIMVVGIKVG